jgi:hypothetical protein
MKMKYPHLFEPLGLGRLNLKNRLAMSPMTMNYATEEGLASERLIRHYLERAGTGLQRVEGKIALFKRGSEEIRRPVGTVVLAVGSEPNNQLYDELASSGFKVVKAGDCLQPRNILAAVREGFEAGNRID